MTEQEIANGSKCIRGERVEAHITALTGRVDDMAAHQDRTDEKLQELEVSQARAGARLAALVTAAVFGATILARFLFKV